MYKTKLGLNYMKNFYKFHPILLKYFIYFSRFVGVFGSVFVFGFMFWQLSYIVKNNLSSAGGFVLPLKTDSSLVFYVPFFYWIISLFVLALVHEVAHGIVAERFKINIKSSGFAFLGVLVPFLPAAFVEPDENKLKKAKVKNQIAILGAGPASNLVFGLIFLLLFLPVANFTSNITKIDKFGFSSIMNESELKNYNLSSKYYEILAVNNITNKSEFMDFLSNISFNDTIILKLKYNESNKTLVNTFKVKPFNNSGKPMIGISGIFVEEKLNFNRFYLGDILLILQKLLLYLWLLNISIGLINLLPIWITDGGQIFRVLLYKKYKENGLKIFNIISLISLILLFLSLFPNLLFF